MKALLNPKTLHSITRLVVTLDQCRFGAVIFLIIVVTIAVATIVSVFN